MTPIAKLPASRKPHNHPATFLQKGEPRRIGTCAKSPSEGWGRVARGVFMFLWLFTHRRCHQHVYSCSVNTEYTSPRTQERSSLDTHIRQELPRHFCALSSDALCVVGDGVTLLSKQGSPWTSKADSVVVTWPRRDSCGAKKFYNGNQRHCWEA